MILEVKVPAAGESIASANVAQWHKHDGELVAKGDTLVTLETDKVSNELEAEAAGTLRILVGEGQEVAIGTVVATIDTTAGTQAVSPPASIPAPSSVPASVPASVPVSVPAPGSVVPTPSPAVAPPPTATTPSPTPTEPSTEVSAARALMDALRERVAATPLGSAPPTVAPPPPSVAPAASADDARVTRRKMSMLRRKIATHLVNAQQTAAILTTFNEVDMSAVTDLRRQVQDEFLRKHGVKLGFMSIFLKSVCLALKDVPAINARIDGEDILQNHYFDIGVAVGTDKGLVVPVVRDVDQKDLARLEHDILDAANKAREGRLTIDDLQGGVFTISNGGVYGSLLSTPILNPPQSGILGMHTIQPRPVAIEGQVVIRPMMYLALSYDHRLVDGKEAVTFLLRVKERVEKPLLLLRDF